MINPLHATVVVAPHTIYLGRSFTGRSTQTSNPSPTGSLIPTPSTFSSAYKSPTYLRFPLVRKNLPPLPHVSTPVAFQHLWPFSPNGFQVKLDFQTFDHTTLSSDFHIDDWFWCGATEFLRRGAIVNAQLNGLGSNYLHSDKQDVQ
ncbi:hypothetical protein AVEN_115481-1 [Araneus ventricosus]|uniref:Uncharacterized protein n=1 Tax=Araneus ventricosus TaxID=182803 RepID=A0A4Y2KUD4_ARAVE|nr:hypothetical protein AVEN_115481-1 [Araneus ventricosus]